MELTRRYFLKSSGALLAYTGIAPLSGLLAQAAANGQPVSRGKTLVVVFLRGGTDGLNLVVPYGDPEYYKLRRTIAIPQPGKQDGAVDLDGFFGLHPQAAALAPLLQSGEATALHAVGYAHNTRSHFEEQDTWETGIIGNTVSSDGWLNRHLLTSTGRGPIRALSIGDNLPRILHGKADAIAIRGLTDLALPKRRGGMDPAVLRAALEDAYCSHEPAERRDVIDAQTLLAQTAGATLESMKHLQTLSKETYQPVAPYPETRFARNLESVARLVKADLGLEVVELTLGGWDTHNTQGGVHGAFGNLCRVLAEGLAAFQKDLGPKMDDVLVLTLSDFGRTAEENGTGGTDHGWGNCMFALGGGVRQVRQKQKAPVLTQWPGLAKEQLNQKRDLLHTTDFRDVIGEVVQAHLGNPNLKRVLPGHAFKPVGLVV
ncbi:MAG: DUF1501 domain-containing protein [Opitutales bacterium]